MKLVSCYVSSFGKLKDFSYDFTGGLNTVKEDNGWGKSTLATFTKAMFYGLDGSAKRTISENERKKYKPWNSTETFGGSINFEWGGKEFKIERFFGNKETDDTLRLYDVKTGKSFTNTEDLGKRIFEIDEEGFLSTTYFSQKDFEIKSNTSITAKSASFTMHSHPATSSGSSCEWCLVNVLSTSKSKAFIPMACNSSTVMSVMRFFSTVG